MVSKPTQLFAMPKITRQSFMQALGITSDSDAEAIKQGLRDILRDCMDWYNSYQYQTEGTIKQLKVAVSIAAGNGTPLTSDLRNLDHGQAPCPRQQP